MSDLSAARPDGSQKCLQPLPQILTSQPGCIHQTKIGDAAQLNFESLKKFLRGVVQARVAIFHVKPLARKFDRAALAVYSEQE